MKILITGASGFVGKHMVKKLSQNHQIVEYDLINGQDVLNNKLLDQKLRGVDLVIHLAAFISATESWEEPMDYMKNNTLGTLSVVKSAIKAGVKKMIFFSSAAVKARPLTPYAVSKINAESILKLYRDKINIVVVRPENIYGPGQKEAYGYVIHNFIKAIKNGKEISIYGDGKQTRDFVYVEDNINAVIRALLSDRTNGESVNIGADRPVTIKELAQKIIRISGSKKSKIKFVPLRKGGEIRHRFPDMTKMKKLIGFRPEHSLEEGLKKTFLWYKSNL